MKKKLSLFAVMLLIVVTVVTLTACNPYKWNSGVTGGSPNEPVYSNGGYFVRQGDYAYFVNGKGDASADNTFGVPYKQSIMRAPITSNGIDSTKSQVVVPQIIYNENTKGGFAIYGQWIYYLTLNNELGPDKKPNTTMSNLMRTTITGSVTQRIATFNSRNVDLLYTPSRILVKEGNRIDYYDVSNMATNKNQDKGEKVQSGTLVSNVIEVMWNYDSDYIFYTQNITGDEAFRGYNKLCVIKADGSGQKDLITKDTYIKAEDKEAFDKNIANFYDQIYSVKLIAAKAETKDSVALYYTRTNIGSNGTAKGLFVNKFTKDGGFNINDERILSTLVPSGDIYALGYEKGCIAPTAKGFVWYEGQPTIGNTIDTANKDLQVLVPSGNKIINVVNDYIYFMPTDASQIQKVQLAKKDEAKENAQLVMQEKMTEWFILDWDYKYNEEGKISNAYLFFFATDDSTYLHVVDILHFNAQDEPFIDEKGEDGKFNNKYDENERFSDLNSDGHWNAKDDSTLVGLRTKADQEAWDKAHEEKK